MTKRHVIAPFFLFFAFALASFSLAQSGNVSSTPQQVLNAAEQAFKNRRNDLTVKKAYKENWLPYSTSFKNLNPGAPYYTPVEGAAGKVGRRLSLASLRRAGKVQKGDIVRLSFNHNGPKYVVLVYADEQDFADEGSQSLFYYPFYTRLEYNVVPPRRHKEHLEAKQQARVKKEGELAKLGSGLAFYQFSARDQKREAEWVTGHALRKIGLYWKLSPWRNATYQVYRSTTPKKVDFSSVWRKYAAKSPSGGPAKHKNAAVCVVYLKSKKISWIVNNKMNNCTLVLPAIRDWTKEDGLTPPGEYLIGSRYTHPEHQIDWYRLYLRKENHSDYYGYNDANIYGRDSMGLHPGTVSLGCVTTRAPDYDDDQCWKALRRYVDSHSMSYRGKTYRGFLYVENK